MLAVMQCILTCITAHQAGILHHDISASNIMIVDLGGNLEGGMLIDWDLSKAISPET
jgi:tRNA A-37 threonylcarbamoyl transferase component Bud32